MSPPNAASDVVTAARMPTRLAAIRVMIYRLDIRWPSRTAEDGTRNSEMIDCGKNTSEPPAPDWRAGLPVNLSVTRPEGCHRFAADSLCFKAAPEPLAAGLDLRKGGGG